HYTAMLRVPLEQITRQVQGFQKAAAGVARVDALSRARPRDALAGPRPGEARELPPGPLGVDFRDVDFRYGDGPGLVLDGVSFSLPGGRTLGLLGRTGSGKTTITRLLFRFYDPPAGAVSLGGVDLRRVPPGAVQRRVGLVTQEVQLFRATVRDNLTLFSPA